MYFLLETVPQREIPLGLMVICVILFFVLRWNEKAKDNYIDPKK